MRNPKPLLVLVLAALAALGSCGAVPNERIQDLLVRQGFGRRAEGDAQVENYASAGDVVTFIMPQALVLNPVFADLALLAAPQPVAIDGTIFVPGVGATRILGMTEKEIGGLVSEALQALYTSPSLQLRARIISGAKSFFMFGEVLLKGRVPIVGDLTMLDAMSLNPPTRLANIGKIRLIRADPKNPLIVTVNMRDIVLDGISTYNFSIRENDIIYVPPTFFGTISRFLQKLLEPLSVAVTTLLQGSIARQEFEILTGRSDRFIIFPGGPLIF